MEVFIVPGLVSCGVYYKLLYFVASKIKFGCQMSLAGGMMIPFFYFKRLLCMCAHFQDLQDLNLKI